MEPLSSQFKRHRLATLLFGLYGLGWLLVVAFVFGGRSAKSYADGGSFVFYSLWPVAVGVVASLMYWLSLSLLATFGKAESRFFWRLLGWAVLLAVLSLLPLGLLLSF